MRFLGQVLEVRVQLQQHFGADRTRRHRRHGVLLGVAGHIAMPQRRGLVGRGAQRHPSRQHEGGQEAQAEHPDQAFIVLTGLAQAAGIAHAHGSQVVVDLALGEARAGIDDAHDAVARIAMHFDTPRLDPVGLLKAAADQGIVRVLDQFAQSDYRGGIQMLAQNRHQPIEIDTGTTDFSGAGGFEGRLFHVIVFSGVRAPASK